MRMKLVYRVICAVLTVSLSFAAVKYFPLTYSTSMRNISPFFSLIFSTMCAGEPPTCGQTVLLTIVTAFVFGFVLPNYSDSQEDDNGGELLEGLSTGERIFAWVCLIGFPIMQSLNTILNRLLRELHENTVSAYANGAQFLIYLIVVLCIGEDASFWLDWSALLWLLMIGCSIAHTCSQTMNFIANQNTPIPIRMPLSTSAVIF